MTDPTSPPERYTSYHNPEKPFSILNEDRTDIQQRWLCREFEYNGLTYGLSVYSGELATYGPALKYLMPWDDRKRQVLATFTDFSTFIKTYEIEGRTLEWILDHQREWKYKMTAEHVEWNAGGFTFAFVYKKIPCCIHEYLSQEWAAKVGWIEGYYIDIGITQKVLFDVAPYSPLTPGAEHWTHDFLKVTEHSEESIKLGPYATMGELLDGIRFGEKTLREIFDTEYDDATTLCGCFGI
jgi:hypothetical protein